MEIKMKMDDKTRGILEELLRDCIKKQDGNNKSIPILNDEDISFIKNQFKLYKDYLEEIEIIQDISEKKALFYLVFNDIKLPCGSAFLMKKRLEINQFDQLNYEIDKCISSLFEDIELKDVSL